LGETVESKEKKMEEEGKGLGLAGGGISETLGLFLACP
jgi:hypothetical protein